MAGLFGFFNYEKPGRGVRPDEEKPEGILLFFTMFFRKFWKLIELNILFLVFSIPIVTIGPAISSVAYITKEFTLENSIWMFTDFWKCFKANFKKSFMAGILDILVYGISVFCIAFLYSYSKNITGGYTYFQYFLVILCLCYIIIYTIMRMYIYIMIVSVKNDFKHIVLNSFILTFSSLPKNILLLVFCFVLIRLHLFLNLTAYIMPFYIIPALGLLINCFVYPNIIKYAENAEESDDFNE